MSFDTAHDVPAMKAEGRRQKTKGKGKRAKAVEARPRMRCGEFHIERGIPLASAP
jgi:hypothetical protein